MWRFTGIKYDTDLKGIPTDRLLQEYAKHADAVARVNYINQRAEFASKDDPLVITTDEFQASMGGMLTRAAIGTELERRGIKPPE
jgi:hypothetical protein